MLRLMVLYLIWLNHENKDTIFYLELVIKNKALKKGVFER